MATPISDLPESGRVTDEEVALPSWATEDDLRQVYDIKRLLPEVETRVTKISPCSDQALPRGSFDAYAEHFNASAGELVAVFWRQFWPPEEGRPWFTVVHAVYETQEDYRNRGIATANYTCSLARYPEIGVRHVLIPAVGAGRTFWPRFGFGIASDKVEAFRDLVRTIYHDKVGQALTGAIPVKGPDMIQFSAPYCAELGKVALEREHSVVFERFL